MYLSPRKRPTVRAFAGDSTITSALLTFSRAHGLPGKCVLVAVSGGIDSTVLFHALAHIRTVPRIELVIGHVHHGLRGAESDEDEK